MWFLNNHFTPKFRLGVHCTLQTLMQRGNDLRQDDYIEMWSYAPDVATCIKTSGAMVTEKNIW
jgi:hypothetical protein